MREECLKLVSTLSQISKHRSGAKAIVRLLADVGTREGGDVLALIDVIVAEYAADLRSTQIGGAS
jgi:hypothetical protein